MKLLKKLFVLILMCVGSFLIFDNVSALSFNVNVKKNRDVVFGARTQSAHVFGNQGGGNISIGYNDLNHTITCNTSKCAVEYYYTATYNTNSSSDHGLTVFAASSQLDGAGWPICNVSGSTISCLVNNNYQIKGLSLYFAYSEVNDNWTINSNLIGVFAIYDVVDEVSSIIDNQNANQQQTNDRLDGINNSLNDSTTDSPSGDFDNFNSMTASNGTITDLITLPISLFTNILNNVNGTCSSYSLGSMFGSDIVLPCINVSNYVGPNLWSIIDILFSGLFVLVISKKMIKVFENFSSMEEGDILD